MSEEIRQEAGQGQAATGGGEENAASVLFGGEGAKTQPDENKTEAPAVPEGGKADSGGVPEGDYDLKMPEGVEVDGQLAAALSPEFKELGLTNAQAQRLVDKYIEAQTSRISSQSEKWSETVSGWVDEAKADKEMGGAKWEETVGSARRAVEQFGTPALADYLNSSGGGNHPEMIRFMAKVGALLKEDTPARGGAVGAGKPLEAAHILFSKDVVTKG